MELDTSTTILIAVAALAVWLTLLFFFLRFTYRIKRQVWNQKQQITLLMMIAHKLGVPESDMEIIKARNDNPDDELLK